MWPCGYFNAGKSPLRDPAIWALTLMGLPVNKIISRASAEATVLTKEDFRAELEKASPVSVIAWDDVGYWMHKPEVRETWALLDWWFFQRWAF